MKHLLLAVLLAAAASAGAARAGTWMILATPALPTTTPNGGQVALPADLSAEPVQPQVLTVEQLRSLWQAAGAAYGVPWAVLGAINKIETDFGKNMGPSSAGAVGWMQFMPGTWRTYGTDANGDGVADPWNAEDAIYSAARYLAASGAATDLRKAVFAYNHADWYVEDVLNLAAVYEAGGGGLTLALNAIQVDLSAAEERVAGAEAALDEALAKADDLAREQREAAALAEREELVSGRLEGEQAAAELGVRAAAQRAEISRLRLELAEAEAALAAARSGLQPGGPGAGGGYVLSAPSFQGGWVFPVGGGEQLVSVALDHHDYPAADIAAPAGSPVYALSDASVLRAWPEPQGRCGIGATVQTGDGRSWTYCHLAYLDAGVTPGAELPAGTFMGLVGETGRAFGPHLHFQLQPASSYPQAEPWFTAFAGQAFRWQDEAAVPPGPVFAVVPADGLNSASAFADR
jgi:murein DD-endopeptidase MepM/ murein hydrolase activator NlpD